MYFWKSKLLPKELRQHIEKTLTRVRGNNLPLSAYEEVKDFVKKSETIISGSIEKKKKEDKK
tara:strand:- start:271 stop:456 length:186 start_codon:yes stop_codon:yes gene_type:complete